MKPVTIVKAYACSTCGKVFEMSPLRWMTTGTSSTKKERSEYRARMKTQAKTCCTCPGCHKKCDRYFGTSDKYCSRCKEEQQCARAASELATWLRHYKTVCQQYKWSDPKLEASLAAHVRDG